MNKNTLFLIILSCLLLGDFTYSFLQYYHTPLDGDMAGGIVPANDVEKIFHDPFGIKMILNEETHPNPNRFFSHYFFREYFQTTPIILQKITSPINSLYLSSAIIKILIHLLLVYLISTIISKSKSIFNRKFLFVALLTTTLFQTYGYNRYMGIIDTATTYSFFYALPLALLILYFVVFYKKLYNNNNVKPSVILLSLLTIILPFSGPLNPPIILIVTFLIVVYYFLKSEKNNTFIQRFKTTILTIPKAISLPLIVISLLSLYSLFLGAYNSTYQNDSVSLLERYSRLPNGIFYQFTQKLGFPLLFTIITINTILIKKLHRTKEGVKILKSLGWIGAFTLIYLICLPLGGYRPYRPNILRFDTILPITIGLIYYFGKSTLFLVQNIKKNKLYYYSTLFLFLVVFTNADRSTFEENRCQIEALQTISNASKKIIHLDNNCTVLTWEPIVNVSESELNAEMLKMLNITEDIILYDNLK